MKRNELLEVIGLGLEPGFLGPFYITHIPFPNTRPSRQMTFKAHLGVTKALRVRF